MKCPNCQRDNPGYAQACEMCGRPFNGVGVAGSGQAMSSASADWRDQASSTMATLSGSTGAGTASPQPPTPQVGGGSSSRGMPTFGGSPPSTLDPVTGLPKKSSSGGSVKVLIWVAIAVGYGLLKVFASSSGA